MASSTCCLASKPQGSSDEFFLEKGSPYFPRVNDEYQTESLMKHMMLAHLFPVKQELINQPLGDGEGFEGECV